MKNGNEKPQKTTIKFYCKKCDFLTSNKKDFNRHVLTRKHNFSLKRQKKTPNVEFKCIKCDKIYKYQSGLSRHKKKCSNIQKPTVDKMINLPKIYHVETENIKYIEEQTFKDLLMQQINQQALRQ